MSIKWIFKKFYCKYLSAEFNSQFYNKYLSDNEYDSVHDSGSAKEDVPANVEDFDSDKVQETIYEAIYISGYAPEYG